MVVPAFALGAPELVVVALVALVLFLPVVALGGLGYLAFVHASGGDVEDRVAALESEVRRLREQVSEPEDDEE